MIAGYSKESHACVRSFFINRLPIKRKKRYAGHKETRVLFVEALDHWQQSGELSAQQHQQIRKYIATPSFDWKRLSRYAFWIAIVCLIIAAINLFSDTCVNSLSYRII